MQGTRLHSGTTGFHEMERYAGCGLAGGAEAARAGRLHAGWGLGERGAGVLGTVL